SSSGAGSSIAASRHRGHRFIATPSGIRLERRAYFLASPMRFAFVTTSLHRCFAVVFASLVGCAGPGPIPTDRAPGPPSTTLLARLAGAVDGEREACRARIEATPRLPELPGAPDFDAHRIEILGRARGEPMVFV